MTSRHAVLAVVLTSACASAPRDAGFVDVGRRVREQTGQPLAWDPDAPVTAAEDAFVAPLLHDELTADRAVQVAFANNRDLQATLEELGVARADLLAATTLRNPVFHLEARFPGSPKTPIEFGLVQTLLDLFIRGPRKRLGEARFAATVSRVSADVTGFAAAVRSDYYDALAAERLLDGQEVMLRAQQAATALAQRQHEAGNIDDLDFENEQARYETAKLDHAQARLAAVQGRERLARDLGLVDPAALRLPAELPPLPEADATPADVAAHAVERRLDLRIARDEIEAAARSAGVDTRQWLDPLTLGVHDEREPDGRRTRGPEIEVPIPIFDRGSAGRQRARAELRRTQQRYAAMLVNARSETREALAVLEAARARLAYVKDVVVPRRERIVQLTLTRHNAMLVGPFALLAARRDLAAAEGQAVLAARDYWRARVALDATLAGARGRSVRAENSLFAEPSPASTPSATKEH